MKSFKGIYRVIAVFMFVLCQTVTAQVWEEIGINLPSGDTASSGTEITFTNKDTGWLFTKNTSRFDQNDEYGYLYRTTDGGQNWMRIIRGSYVLPNNWTVLYSLEPDFCYLIRGKKALFTTDGGATWDSTVINLGGDGSSALYFFNEQKGITFDNYSWITTDGGKTWVRKGEISSPLDVYFYNDKLGWAVGYSPFSTDVGYLAKTTDGGISWEYVYPRFGGQTDYYGVEFIDSLKGFAAIIGVVKTTDGGKNWTYVPDVGGCDIGFLNDKYGWISGGGQIYGTSDGGETWETQLDTIKNFIFEKIIILKKDKAAYVLGTNPVDNTATLLKTDLSSITGIEENKQDIPEKFNLEKNYPNPFNPVTTIKYGLPQNSRVTLEVYNILGEKVESLVNGVKSAGYHEAAFNAGNLASGIYIYRLTASSLETGKQFVKSAKMMLIK